MKQAPTLIQDDLIAYLYNELPRSERRNFESHLDHDDDLYLQYNQLADAKMSFEPLQLQPQKVLLQRLLAHSRQTRPAFG